MTSSITSVVRRALCWLAPDAEPLSFADSDPWRAMPPGLSTTALAMTTVVRWLCSGRQVLRTDKLKTPHLVSSFEGTHGKKRPCFIVFTNCLSQLFRSIALFVFTADYYYYFFLQSCSSATGHVCWTAFSHANSNCETTVGMRWWQLHCINFCK